MMSFTRSSGVSCAYLIEKRDSAQTGEISRGGFGLLRVLLASPQRISTREQLLQLTHIDSAEVYDRSIDTQIMRLRRKIEVDPAHPRFIRTERGMGYYFDAPVSVIRS
jgi:DNA-binding response OmpR family regulator